MLYYNRHQKKGILKTLERKYPDLKYDDDNLMLTAQHTHSGPGGYSYYGLYNLSIPGFVMEVYQKIVQGIVEAIVNAEQNIQPARLSWSSGVFEGDKEVAYNRSVPAYNLNPEVKQKISFEQRHLGLDREMTLLKIAAEDGKPLGSVNWFGVHPTNLPNTNNKICFDNKGYAAEYLEKYFQDKSKAYLAAFEQGTCGDVTPRFVHHPVYPYQRGQWEGKFPDDLESANITGSYNLKKPKKLLIRVKKMK